jgi:hypothetical protein
MEMMDGGSLDLILNKKQHNKYMRREGFELKAADLAKTEAANGDKKISVKAHELFHTKVRHALKHKKNLRVNKTYYDVQLEGAKNNVAPPPAAVVEQKAKQPRKKQPKKQPTKDQQKQPKASVVEDVISKQPDHILIPHGGLLRGIPVQGKGEYKIPLVSDAHSFAIRKRMQKD